MHKCRTVDLDGTLVYHYPGDPIEKDGKVIIGAFIPKMSNRIKKWISKGNEVIIFTARLYNDSNGEQEKAIREACRKEFNKELEVTNIKRPGMTHFYDDRATRVIRNTGILVK